jgi:transcription elongation GreA/GreB family factor
MSRAFVKEDVDPPERSRRARAASGLPPGAVNDITARGAELLRAQLNELRREASADEARIADLRDLLAAATVIEPPEDRNAIAFGARVTVRHSSGERRAYQIVGVDELNLYSDAVSWISPIGKALLAAERGARLTLENDPRVEIVSIEYPAD